MGVSPHSRDSVPTSDRALRDAISRIIARGLDHCRRSYIVSLEDAPDDEHEEGIWSGLGAQTPDHWPSWTELCTVNAVDPVNDHLAEAITEGAEEEDTCHGGH